MKWFLAYSESLSFFTFSFQSEKIKFYTMSVLRPDTESANMEEIVFLYRYGVSLTSILPKLPTFLRLPCFDQWFCRQVNSGTNFAELWWAFLSFALLSTWSSCVYTELHQTYLCNAGLHCALLAGTFRKITNIFNELNTILMDLFTTVDYRVTKGNFHYCWCKVSRRKSWREQPSCWTPLRVTTTSIN